MDDVERSKQGSRNAARPTTRKRRPQTDQPVESGDETSATRPTQREQRSVEAENGSEPTPPEVPEAKTARPRRSSTTRKRRPPTDEPVELGDETAATRPTEREQRSAEAEDGSGPTPPAAREVETARSTPTPPTVSDAETAPPRRAPAKAKAASSRTTKREPKTPATRAKRSAEPPSPAKPLASRPLPAKPLAEPPSPAKLLVRSEICEICEVRWWRGFVKSDFYAEALRPDGTQYEVGRSPMFWWWRADQPERTHATAAALQDLVERLMRAGWEPDGHGATWYQHHFRRPVPAGLSVRLKQSTGTSRSPDAGGAA